MQSRVRLRTIKARTELSTFISAEDGPSDGSRDPAVRDGLSEMVFDPQRLAALDRYHILDSAPEDGFDDVVELARDVCSAPTALVSFVAADRQWFKARAGFDRSETPLEQSVCAHAIVERELLVIPDLTVDPRTRDNPLVTGSPFARFYAGAVLRAPDGQALGSLCVLDIAPRPHGLSDRQTRLLLALARQVMALLAMRVTVDRSLDALAAQVAARRQQEAIAGDSAERELKLRLAIEATRIGIFDYDVAADRLEWDARTRELFGVAPEGEVTYAGSFLANLHPDDHDMADGAVKAALDPAGDGLFDIDYRIVPVDGRLVRWLSARGRAVFGDGGAARLVGAVRDITERRTADDKIASALERYTLVGKATNDAIWDWDLVTDYVTWNEALATAYGWPLDEVEPTPQWWIERVHPEDRDQAYLDIRRVIEGGGADWRHEYRFLCADGRYASVFDRGNMIRDARGAPVRMIGAMLDLTDRKEAEERQRLLNHELSHRMKNQLAMVQAIASQTMRGAASLEAAGETLSGRLMALAKAHDVLLEGKAGAARLSSIAAEALRVHADDAERIEIRGPDVQVGSKATLPIVLMLHELGTNAVKYGALSAPEGRIAVEWQVSGPKGEEAFRLTWRERNGPKVSAPARQGFGIKLIERGLALQLGATVSIDYAPEGVACVLEAPLARLQQGD